MTEIDTMKAMIEALKLENAKLAQNAKKERSLSFKVGKSGGISVYGLQKFPVTLYVKQWEKLFAVQADLKAFIETHGADIVAATEAKEAA